jgi:hypothetical protein
VKWRRIHFKITKSRTYNDRSEDTIKSMRRAVMIKQNLPVTGMQRQLRAREGL